MSEERKRRVTGALLFSAGAATLVALVLGGADRSADASRVKTASHLPGKAKSAAEPVAAKPAAKKPGSKAKSEPAQPKPQPKPAVRPRVDVVFALDTTGSMSGLIEGAKRKIWAIANAIMGGQPRPRVRIGLVGYRDVGDKYVTRRYQLSENIDDVYRHLRRFRAGGGGDTPEHVNRALADAIDKMEWSQGDKVLKLVFLVGDAPPHEGRGGLRSSVLARKAHERGILINTVRCGRMRSTQRAWRRIAKLSGGRYASIRQDGAIAHISTPMDKRLAELNRKLTATLLASGSAKTRSQATARARSNAAMGAAEQAESAVYRSRSGKLDSADLLARVKGGEKLEDLDESELPAKLRAMDKSERRDYVAKVAKKRARLKQEIVRLSSKRRRYLRKRARATKRPTSFDDTVVHALRVHGPKAGLKY